MLPPDLTVANLGFSLAMMAGVEARKRGGGRVHRMFAAVSGVSGSKVADKSGMPGMRWHSMLYENRPGTRGTRDAK